MNWFLVLFGFIASTNSFSIKQTYLKLLEDDRIIFPKERNLPKNRIFLGNETNENDFLYQVGLYSKKGNYFSFCGGSLIAPDIVLTTARCINNVDEVYVFYGHHYNPDYKKVLNNTEENVLKSTVFKVHEDYDENYLRNNIALVYLPEKIALNEHVALVPLDNGTDKHVGEIATVSGWGLTFQGESFQSGRSLRYVQDVIISNEKCSSVFEQFLGQFDSLIKDSNICLSDRRGPCLGDEGGPLVIDGVQVGIVSIPWAMCTPLFPSVFTRVSSFAHWIANNTQRATSTSTIESSHTTEATSSGIIYNPTYMYIFLVLIIGLIKN